ncbi:MATE family efflux transporter [Cocleimonas sp. KMM 6892]|uniref:MATE family efflux transporter n=1 Tax=unclassified Cocleimonas TaxID=2639732 RepID=UPI002DBAC449|nr:MULTISPECIES: MATE family efflux transporter [unclassified Cocleimonas]MEB8433192.1 MATE family efflux transporter [Cocleimonas sp. KMM 6892]MEC4715827.1 MATE family efflux transporter [Cocleimonas sp. KMM 6895]MEC4745288.1 MATE family efflux transporter [Cocleimonas sp. KMM 6896]
MTNANKLSPSHKQVWALAGPIIVSNLSIPLVGAVDTAVVGHLPGPESIGAVALGALIFSFLFWGFGFLKMGTTGFIAQAYGADNEPLLLDTLSRVIILALGLGLFSILISYPIIQFALYLLDGTPAVEALTANYAHIRIWSAPATLSTYVFTGVFIGMHNTKRVLILLLVLNFTNILLDLVFVVGFNMGVEGVAYATLIAEYLAAACGFFMLREPIKKALARFSWKAILERQAITRLLSANSDIFIRTLCLVFSLSYFTAISTGMGEVVLAANAILLHLQSIMAYALDGFAHAAEALTGSAYGARNKKAYVRSVKMTSVWAFGFSVLISAIYLIFGEMILGFFTNIDEVLATATTYLPWMIIAPLVSIWSFQIDGIFIGASYTKEMRNAMLVSTLIFLVLLQFLVPQWGNHGLFLGLSLFMLIRALTLGFFYPRILKALKE